MHHAGRPLLDDRLRPPTYSGSFTVIPGRLLRFIAPGAQIRADSNTHVYRDGSMEVRHRKLNHQSAVAEMGAVLLLYSYEDDEEPLEMGKYWQHRCCSGAAGGSRSVNGDMVKLYKLSWSARCRRSPYSDSLLLKSTELFQQCVFRPAPNLKSL